MSETQDTTLSSAGHHLGIFYACFLSTPAGLHDPSRVSRKTCGFFQEDKVPSSDVCFRVRRFLSLGGWVAVVRMVVELACALP